MAEPQIVTQKEIDDLLRAALKKEWDNLAPKMNEVMMTVLTQLAQDAIKQLVSQQPAAIPPPAPPPPVAPKPAPPPPPKPAAKPIEDPSVQLSAAGLGITTILQALGYVGTPFGMGAEPTQAGTLATLIPVLTGMFGATGGFGTVLRGISAFIAAFRAQPK